MFMLYPQYESLVENDSRILSQTANARTYDDDFNDDALIVSKQGYHIARLYANRKCGR
jgi:hypothetical protein